MPYMAYIPPRPYFNFNSINNPLLIISTYKPQMNCNVRLPSNLTTEISDSSSRERIKGKIKSGEKSEKTCLALFRAYPQH